MADPRPDVGLHEAVDVRASTIAGRGVFARTDLSRGAVVLRLPDGASETVDRLGVDFPNHACDPNVGWLDERTLATMTDVAAGEELVTDYAMSIVEPEWFLRCHCPSYRCRQMVEGTYWRIPQLQRRYAGWWAPHVQALVDAT